MKEIQLTNGGVALVDDADFDLLNQYKWGRKQYSPTRIYAVRQEGTWKFGTYKMIRMHRQILGLPNGRYPEVDHRDLNGLNNQRGNLRLATHSLNRANRRKQRNNTSGFKGVFFNNKRFAKPWYAKIGSDKSGTARSGGFFATAEEAARRYDEMAIEVYGQFARVNFPNENDHPTC